MSSNLHQIETICFVFDAENDLILLQQYGNGKYARLHTGVNSDCLLGDDIANSCKQNVKEQAGIEISGIKLRGILKTVNLSKDESSIYFVYEAEFINGDIQQNAKGRLKWVEVLNIFNLKYIPFVKSILNYLLDGESFFEAFFELDKTGHIVKQQVYSKFE